MYNFIIKNIGLEDKLSTKSLLKNDYVITFSVSIFSILAAFLVSGIFARIFSKTDFLLFNLLTRYCGFLYTVVSGMIGYGVIYNQKKKTFDLSTLFSSSLIYYVIVYLFTITGIALFFHKDSMIFGTFNLFGFVLGTIWVLSQSIKHLVVLTYRGLNKHLAANNYELILNVFLVFLSILIITLIEPEYYSYHFYYGLISLIISGYFVYMLKINIAFQHFSLPATKAILSFSVSRWLEHVFRFLLLIVLLSILNWNGQMEIAGYIAILYTLVKVIESSLQALISVIFSKSSEMNKDGIKSQIKIFSIISLSFSILVVFIFYLLGESLIRIWLGSQYLLLVPFFQLLSWSVFPIVFISLIKGVFEFYFKHSPLMLLNILTLFGLSIFFFIDTSIYNILYYILFSYWLKMLLYLLIIKRKMLSIFEKS